jgi:hypothetical protein
VRAKFIYEKFTQDSDPIKDMGIGRDEFIKHKLGLKFGEPLPSIFAGKPFYGYSDLSNYHMGWDCIPGYGNQYKNMVFYDIKDNLIRTTWSMYIKDKDIGYNNMLSYPISAFEKELCDK